MANFRVPVGFTFAPTDEELVGFFLYRLLVLHEPIMQRYKCLIHSCNLYGNNSEPSELWTKNGGDQLGDQDQALYFWSVVKILTPKRADRKMGRLGGGGSWCEKEGSKLIMDGNSVSIGRKRKFKYVNENSKDHCGWFLEEYSLFSRPKTQEDISYDYTTVICRIRKNDRSEIHKRECSSSQDQSKKKPKNKRNQKDQVGSSGSSQNMNVVVNSTIDDHDEEVRQGSSSAFVSFDNFDFEDMTMFDNNFAFTVNELLSAEPYEVSLPTSSELNGADGQGEEACNTSNLDNNNTYNNERLLPENNEVYLPTISELDSGDRRAEEACNPSNIGDNTAYNPKGLLPGNYELSLPTAFGRSGAYGRAEEACNPSISHGNNTYNMVDLFIKYEAPLPTASGLSGAYGGAKEAWNPSIFDDNNTFKIEGLRSENYEASLPIGNGIGGAYGGSEDAWKPNISENVSNSMDNIIHSNNWFMDEFKTA